MKIQHMCLVPGDSMDTLPIDRFRKYLHVCTDFATMQELSMITILKEHVI